MALVDSLLTAIARADGDALVMHVGEKPYVVASTGPIELSTHGLNLQAMAGMVAQLLPPDAQRSLVEFGAVEHELPAQPDMPSDRFSVVVARGGDDIWIEVRRHRAAAFAAAVESVHAQAPVSEQETVYGAAPAAVLEAPANAHDQVPVASPYQEQHAAVSELREPHSAAAQSDTTSEEETPAHALTAVAAPEPLVVPSPSDELPPAADAAHAAAVDVVEPVATVEEESEPQAEPVRETLSQVAVAEAGDMTQHVEPAEPEAIAAAESVEAVAALDTTAATPIPITPEAAAPPVEHVLQPAASVAHAEPVEESEPAAQPAFQSEPVVQTVVGLPFRRPEPVFAREEHAGNYAVAASAGGSAPGIAAVIPMTRTLRIEVPPSNASRGVSHPPEIERLLAAAASRGATALYLTTGSSPHVRVDADIRVLEGEPPLAASDVENAVASLAPEDLRDSVHRGEPTEWLAELTGVGPVRCSTFRDHRGPGAIFQLTSTRPVGAAQLKLGPDIESLATESEGLVLVTGLRASGKSTLLGALVDLINRERPHYVITLERQISVVHEHHSALISQRELRGTPEQILSSAQAALRENPDVLVIEELSSAELVQLALEAAGSGVLVLASVSAPSTSHALMQLTELFAADKRRTMQALLAERLRGAVAQVLLRKLTGGRVAARELLLPTAAVTAVIAEGRLEELPQAFDSGSRHGLVSMTTALADLVRSNSVDVRDAYRKADDRPALVAALRRENVDTTAIERLA
jgi:twitching motility protein PilT